MAIGLAVVGLLVPSLCGTSVAPAARMAPMPPFQNLGGTVLLHVAMTNCLPTSWNVIRLPPFKLKVNRERERHPEEFHFPTLCSVDNDNIRDSMRVKHVISRF